MNKKEAQELTNDIMVADLIIKIKSLTNLLISKNIFSEEEFKNEVNDITKLLTLNILEKANVKGDLEKIIEDLKK